MGITFEADNIVLLLDNYGEDSKKLHTSFLQAGKKYPVFVIEEDGFLPEGVTSVFGYFLGAFATSEKVPGKPRYFNQITVPEYWEISANNNSGKVHELNKERARIFYAEPKHKRLVKVVDWYDDRGVVRSSDHYNRYGALYARTIFNSKGQRVNKSYFNAEGKEILTENYVTRDIILNDGDVVRIFKNKHEFTTFVLQKAGYAGHRIFFNTLSTSFFVSERLPENGNGDVLFWQEPISDEIPGNMRLILNGTSNRAAKIMVQSEEAYRKLLALGAPAEKLRRLGYIYPFVKENLGKKEVLICTNSDRIAEVEKIVEALPELHFSIAAITEMSSKLMSMEKYSNVSLYPGVKMKVLDELFMKADFYLDINHESEIVSAVEKAFLHNQLIFAFKETLHNAFYVATEHIYTVDRVNELVLDIKAVMGSTALLKEYLERQKKAAMQESAETYLGI
ncbi:MAG: accessory Sec system glycosylation chaperone GtfB [Lachnospiraceae bacterium]|nr:accessory Sec system glycosylation chaperone GtfB [Lachnospiraceae bacterium]